MAAIPFRANLLTEGFPFNVGNMGQTVIVPRYEVDRSGGSEDRNSLTPQAYYMHNVIPTQYGYQTPRFVEMINAPGGGHTGFMDVLEIYNSASAGNPLTKQYIGCVFTSAGLTAANPVRYFFAAVQGSYGSENWQNFGYTGSRGTTIPGFAGFQYSAYVNGRNFIAPGNVGAIYEVNFNVQTIGTVSTNLGIAFNGICAASGYLIGWTVEDSSVYWSSTSNPADFAPSQVTGAGGGGVQEARGRIVCCVGVLGGFYICTSNNIVFAAYTGNARYPFQFKEVKGAAGIGNQYQVASDVGSEIAFILSSAGLMMLQGDTAQLVEPDLQAFLFSGRLEYYDTATHAFVSTSVDPNSLYTRLAFVCKRYLAISYGPTVPTASTSGTVGIYSYDYALIYDTVLKRWGKLKLAHTKIFTQSFDIVTGISSIAGYRDYIGVLLNSGQTYMLNMEIIPTTAALINTIDFDKVLILGKYQLDRGSFSKLNMVSVDGNLDSSIAVRDYYSYDGNNKAGIGLGFIDLSPTATHKTYNFDVPALNHSLVLTGYFNLVNLISEYIDVGDQE